MPPQNPGETKNHPVSTRSRMVFFVSLIELPERLPPVAQVTVTLEVTVT
jgi:hypothetical protein